MHASRHGLVWVLLAGLIACKAFAQISPRVKVPTSSSAMTTDTSRLDAWVPRGWKVIGRATGDLNQDGRDDNALVIEEDNPANRKTNENLGAQVLNLNPRRLIVLLQTSSGYRQVLSKGGFLPSEGDEDSPCLADPLQESEGVRLHGGLLKIDLHYWFSCGTYGVYHKTFKFRLEGDRFRLIGLDTSDFMRNTGNRSEKSINFLTRREKSTTGLNEFEESAPSTTWKKIPSDHVFYLDEMDRSCNSADKDGWCQY